MRNFIFLIAVLLNSCGDKAQDAEIEAQDARIEKPRETYTSYFFKSKGDLGACDESKENWLAYVKADRKFYACSDSEWFIIEQEKTEVLRETVTFENNEFLWRENETGTTWVLLSTAKKHPYQESKSWAHICELNNYKTPTRNEIISAARNGLYINLLKRSAGDEYETVWFEDSGERKGEFDRMAGVYNAKTHYVAGDSVAYVYDITADKDHIFTVDSLDIPNYEASNWNSSVVCKR